MPPSMVRRSASGLITSPQSCAQTSRFTQTRPVWRFTSTSAISATTVWLRKAYAMPRPVRMSPVPRGFGDGRGSQPYVSAAALTHRDRARALEAAVVVGAGGQQLQAELDRIGLRRRRQLVDERLGRERDLRAVRIAQVAGAQRRLPDQRQARRPASPCAGSGWRTCPTASPRCRRPAWRAACPSAARSARCRPRCSRRDCSRRRARRSRARRGCPAHRAPPRILKANAGPLVSHAVSSCRIHCTRTGRPISFARYAASKPASSAAVRP